ncbi:MAG: type II CRISPR RNA-guided endonuclease Cas9 [Prevotella sp.]|jgi:CRISPR-associated endonuclease Csn1
MGKRILGLDTGTNSLGWAVVDRDEDNNYELKRWGDLIFQEGVKVEKGIESSKAADRTSHRSLRKQYFRRRLRKINVLRVLVKNNLCPFLSDEQLHEWHVHKIYPTSDEFMLWQRTNDNEEKNPYYYRHLCLHEKLDLNDVEERYILGRALYHLAQRRGFLSNRLDTSSDQSDDGAVKTGITELSKEMESCGCEYLGDYFYKIYSDPSNHERIRSRYTDREQHYKKEFYAICERQQLPEDLKEELAKALYFQRPLKSQRHGVGKCTFEPRKPRCADSHPDYEEFRMLAFVNNIKIQSPYDTELRNLNSEEKEKISHLFYRVSKPNFDFEDIAKCLAGRNNYQWIKDVGDRAYKFNYRMTQGVPGCPTTAQLIHIFGGEWKQSLAETYKRAEKKNGVKSIDEMVNDVWNVLYSFSSNDKLKDWSIANLQLDEETADKFSKIKLTHSFAALSLKAIRKILPFLRMGMIYSHAVEFANIPTIVGSYVWDDEEKREFILKNVIVYLDDKDQTTRDHCIKGFLNDNFDLRPGDADKLYHPSMIETYQDAKMKNGVYQLGSPMTNAIRNPMAMRSLHEMRKVINALLKEKVIDQNTEVHVEYARELNDANKRKAIADYNREREKENKKYANDIRTLYKKETGKDIEPTNEEILKFRLWNEQEHKCLYTGKQIGIADFIGPNPKYDIEHTVPRSVGGDSTEMNLTLCESKFNREVKKALLPSQLANHEDILLRIEPWKKKSIALSKDADKCRTHSGMAKDMKDRIIEKRHLLRMKRDYWKGKYERFTMTEVPEGFSRRQGGGIGLVSKYAALYLKSLFHDPKDRHKSHVFSVKGTTTAEFRKMWGLQEAYEKKSRDNHVHHCIDAITIACIGKHEYDEMAKYYHDEELFDDGRGRKPQFKKPWPTFTQDVLNLEKELLVVHSTKDNMPKKSKKYVRTTRGKFLAKGDSARGSLHNDTYYGAIERDGEIKYVVRRPIDSFEKESDFNAIVDDTVRNIIMEAVQGKDFKQAIKEPIYMNKEKGILIKKVRCFAPTVKRPLHIRRMRDLSRKSYKQQFHVTNDKNYCMALYEGEVRGRIKRDFEFVNMLDAAAYFKKSNDREAFPTIVPRKNKDGFALKSILKIGTMVLLYEHTPSEINFDDSRDVAKRLYKVTGLSILPTASKNYGRIYLRYHQEARQAKDIKTINGAFKQNDPIRPAAMLLNTQFNALVEGVDFRINVLGEIELLNK